MSEPKFTPGPWYARLDGDNEITGIVSDTRPVIQGTEFATLNAFDEDIRLVIAAPDLLAVCETFLAVRSNYGPTFDEPFDHDDDFINAIQAMESAVSKATGGPKT